MVGREFWRYGGILGSEKCVDEVWGRAGVSDKRVLSRVFQWIMNWILITSDHEMQEYWPGMLVFAGLSVFDFRSAPGMVMREPV